jgi:hypothetical protein
MLNYPTVKSLGGLLFTFLFLTSPGLAQGVRMSADFFPLEVGRNWSYDVTNDAGEKVGQAVFSVEDYTIISGTSFYVLSEFPFPTFASEPIQFVRYDRTERYFLRKIRNDEGPLFVDAGASTEVLESDASGAPQKFVLRWDKTSLTFQRGVGIVEARFEQSGARRIAKLTGTRSKSAPAPLQPVARAPLVPLVPAPAAPSRPEVVGTVTESNPRLDLVIEPAGAGYRFVMAVVNQSDILLPFRFNSGKTYDFVIHDAASGREVWRWSSGNFFTQVLRSDSIRAKGKWQFQETWDGKDNEGKPVPPGSYRVTGILTSTPPLQASPVAFEVK